MGFSRVRRGIEDPALVRQYVGDRLIETFHGRRGRNDGHDVVDADWDNLLILDACRYDVFKKVCDIDGDLRRVTSRGSATYEFLEENFDGRALLDTVYVSANAVVGACSDYLDVYKLKGVWDDDRDSIADPEPVVRAAREAHRAYPDKRLIVHFLPPHEPHLVKDGAALPDDSPYRNYDAARRGEVTASGMQSVYRENLAHVQQYVAGLADDLTGKTVVTADHGELVGEGFPTWLRVLHPRWGVRSLSHFDYGHYAGIRVPELVDVPWLELPFDERRETVAADAPADVEMDEAAIEGQLEALGYR